MSRHVALARAYADGVRADQFSQIPEASESPSWAPATLVEIPAPVLRQSGAFRGPPWPTER
eukprot:1153897-Alexandrium_andersonii.AAC.1